MTLETLIHPEDARTLKALKSIPALPKIMEKVFQYGYDEISWSENITTNLRLSETQMPEIYNRLPPICKRLNIPVPELYLQMTPIANAWTSGQTKPYIVLTLGLIRRLTPEELDAVLAHECGHIVCQHVLYQTLADAIFTLGDSLADSIVGLVGNAAMKPIKQALIAWSRASELSADRFACIVSDADTLARALARISLIPRHIVNGMDINAWAEQGKDYEALKNGTAWNKVLHWISNADIDHPYCPVRVYEAQQWEKTDVCKQLKAGTICIETSPKEVVLPSKESQTTAAEIATTGREIISEKGRELADKGQELAGKGREMLKNVNIPSFFKK